jgi:hypothetical protein
VRAAVWHEGAVEIARRGQRDFRYYKHGVAEDFVKVIKEMLRAEIPARFDAKMGKVWDIEKGLKEHEGEWPESANEVFGLRYFDEPDGGWEAARERSSGEVDWADRMEGWELLTGNQ